MPVPRDHDAANQLITMGVTRSGGARRRRGRRAPRRRASPPLFASGLISRSNGYFATTAGGGRRRERCCREARRTRRPRGGRWAQLRSNASDLVHPSGGPHSVLRNRRPTPRRQQSPALPRRVHAERTASGPSRPPTPGAAGHSTGAAGHCVSESLPRRARSAARNRALACTLHGPRALCREHAESEPSQIPARRARPRPPDPWVTRVRNRYCLARPAGFEPATYGSGGRRKQRNPRRICTA